MISDLGFSATPVALLLSLRYFLIPIGIWSGEISDRRRFLGTRRLFWIWSGRALMLLGNCPDGLADGGTSARESARWRWPNQQR